MRYEKYYDKDRFIGGQRERMMQKLKSAWKLIHKNSLFKLGKNCGERDLTP